MLLEEITQKMTAEDRPNSTSSAFSVKKTNSTGTGKVKR